MTVSGQYEITDGAALYRRLLAYVRPFLGMFSIAVVAMMFSAAAQAGVAALMKPMLDGSFVDQDPTWITLVPLLFIGLFLITGIAGFASSYSMTWMGRGVIKELRREMFDKLLNLPAAFYDRHSSGKLISKMSYDVEQVSQATTQAVTVLIQDTLTIICLLAWMFYLNWMLTLVFAIVGPLFALLVAVINQRFRRISTRIQASMGDITHVTQESVQGHRIIKTFGGKDYERGQFEQVNEHNRRQCVRLGATSAASVPIIQFIAALAVAGILYLATLGPMLEQITVGTFMSFVAAMMLLAAPLKRLTTINVVIQRGIAAARSVFALLDSEAEKDTGRQRVARAKGEVEYRHVSFVYDYAKGGTLEDISLHINPGERVALVGHSGSGKTTLASLLLRFYDVEQGSILLDGRDIRELSLDNLRDQISLVGQDVFLFNDTIARNIAYGRFSDVQEADIIRAAQAAHAMEFIQQLPDGIDTVVGEKGVLLSGGQRQRLAIARAMLKDAPILVLDEATSSLDSDSERQVQAGLEELMHNRTTLVIAHRLSTIEQADNIVVLQHGRIVEQGRHHDLLAAGAVYARLYQMQFHPEQGELRDSPAYHEERAG